MPIIVPIEDNKVGLATATDAKFRAPDYSGSGLEALGAGLVKVGGGLEERRRRAAEAIAAAMLDDRHQSNIDDAAVKKAYVDYSDLRHEALHGENGLFNQTGAAAHAAFPDTIAALAEAHDKVVAPLDDVQRGVVGGMLKEELRRDVDRAADHVGRQGVEEQKWQSEQLQRAAARDAANHADDPNLFDHHFQTGKNALVQQAKLTGAPDRVLAKQIADYTSRVHADTIDALAQRDPVHAAGRYARHGDKLNQRDRSQAEAQLGPAMDEVRAAADVHAASADRDPTIAPASPHVGDDARLLLKMQGITPMMDQTELPTLMQRYGNDPAKAWAAFEAGPETIDRLIAQRGDDWYAGLGEDTRRFVDGNMSMIEGRGSPLHLAASPISSVVYPAFAEAARPGEAMAPGMIRASLSHTVPITFDDHGKPVVGTDGKSFGQSMWDRVFGAEKAPPSPWDYRPPTRKEIIISDGAAGQIVVRSNPKANGNQPSNEVPSLSRVHELEAYIVKSAKKYHVDPDLIRAIVYMETTHGWYDAPLRPFDLDKSILPMNINTEFWGDQWGTRGALRDPARNVDGGTRMLRAIIAAMPRATVAKVATIFNDSNANVVNDYGARVDRIYREKPWRAPLQPAKPGYSIGTRSTLP